MCVYIYMIYMCVYIYIYFFCLVLFLLPRFIFYIYMLYFKKGPETAY